MAVRLIGTPTPENPIVVDVPKIAEDIIRNLYTKGPPEKLERLSRQFPEYEETLLMWRDAIVKKIAQ